MDDAVGWADDDGCMMKVNFPYKIEGGKWDQVAFLMMAENGQKISITLEQLYQEFIIRMREEGRL